jgi:hypothetical protein
MNKIRENINLNGEKADLGFTLPEKYFENFQDSLFNKIEIEKARKIHQVTLGFKIPEVYFENSLNEIQNKIKGDNNHIYSLVPRNKWYLASIAASIAILFFLNIFNQSSSLNKKDLPVIVDTHTHIENDIFSLEEDETLATLFIEDKVLDELLDAYIIDKLIIEDIVSN